MPRYNPRMREINKALGKKMQELRVSQGKTLGDLAPYTDVTHQQLQKYEIGQDGISAARLILLAEALDRPVNCFFEDIDINLRSDIMSHKRYIQISRDFNRIKIPVVSKALASLVREIANAEEYN